MLLRDLSKLLEGPAPDDEDPEDLRQGAKIVEVGDDVYEGTDALTRRSKLRPLAKMGASYAGKVVSRADLEAQDEQEGDQDIDYADASSEDDFRQNEEENEGQDARAKGRVHFEAGDDVIPEKESEQSGGHLVFHFDGEQFHEKEDDDMEQDDDEDDGIAENFAKISGSSRALASSLEEEMKRVEIDEKAFLLQQTKGTHKKALAVRAQNRLWEGTLKTRIRLQGPMSLASRLPKPERLPAFKTVEPKLKAALKTAAESTLNLMRSLLEVQQTLLTRSQVLPTPTEQMLTQRVNKGQKRKRKEILSEAQSLWNYAQKDFHAQIESYGETMERWRRKTKLAAGQGGRKFKALDRTVTHQIEDILSDMDTLRKRTQLRRNPVRILGDKEPERKEDGGGVEGRSVLYDEEIFDDTDFYQELLREVIDASAMEGVGSLSKTRRVPKLARKLKDRRASKGRKIRYVAISELANFSTPKANLDEDYPVDTLFSSLFGADIGNANGENVENGRLGEGFEGPAEKPRENGQVDEFLDEGIQIL
ncbi:hypothetical protein AAMO2058_001637300 [Amorphochlora amoebiformis]